MNRGPSPKGPPVVELDSHQLGQLLQACKELLPPDVFEMVKGLSHTLQEVMRQWREHGATIARLRRLFGLKSSEKLKNLEEVLQEVLGAPEPSTAAAEATASSSGTAAADPPSAGAPAAAGEEGGGPVPLGGQGEQKKKKVKGHGRIPASADVAATHVAVTHASLRPGDGCPDCGGGKLYRLKEPASIVRIVGQAPLHAMCWDCEQLRCSTCQKVYTARAPEEAQGPKYDETAASMLALLSYEAGMPLHRLERLQHDLQTPVPSSTQWDVLHDRVELFQPVDDELVKLAAQGTLLHSDDSSTRVLELMGKRRAALLKKGELSDPERTGLFTTALVSLAPLRPPIALYRSGRKHAGENLEDLLDKRDPKLGPPLLMGDALARNVPEGHEVIESNCLAHARRNFLDEASHHPAECKHLFEAVAHIYKADADCQKEKLSDQERLLRHPRDSAPVMAELRSWMQQQLDNKQVEPNSGLGKAYNDMLQRWDKFTLFLRMPGAPLDNNLCERVLKMAIRHRNNSLFYRSSRGAEVGDLSMSLLHTTQLCGENPFDYLTAIQRHFQDVAEKPADWLPWTYKGTLARKEQAKAPSQSGRPATAAPRAPAAAVMPP